ncbi:hypothetical protein OHV05_33900 [Kitasatospora sp. NBC_00070]
MLHAARGGHPRRSLSFSITKQLGDPATPQLVTQLRAGQEDFVRKLLAE